jgi:hypothetical protein
MATNWFEVPENETFAREFFGLLGVVGASSAKPQERAWNRFKMGRLLSRFGVLAGSKKGGFRGIILTVAERT